MLLVNIPAEASKILEELRSNGFEAYLVGGTARDLIIEQHYPILSDKSELKDFDITTNATPDQIKKVYSNYRQLYMGERHGTITIRYNKIMYDITTYRVDGTYSDGRRPDSVLFVSDLTEDLSRRDFTINAITLDAEGHVNDPFHGLNDLQNGLIRTVGDPKKRFQEDSLRLLRAIRFAVRFNFQIERATFEGMINSAPLIVQHEISMERIFTELEKSFDYHYHNTIDILMTSRVFEFIFPQVHELLVSPKTPFSFDYLSRVSQLSCVYPGLPWLLIFHPLYSLGYGFKRLEKIIKEYKGMNKDLRDYIVISILGFKSTLSLLNENVSTGDVYRWILEVRSPYKNNYNEYWGNLPHQLLCLVKSSTRLLESSSVPKTKFTFLRETTSVFCQLYDNNKMPVDGNDAKSIGCKGKAIRWMIDIWDKQYHRDHDRSREMYLGFGEQLSRSVKLQFDELIRKVAISSPSGSSFEQKAIRDELSLLGELFSYFSGTLHLIITDEMLDIYSPVIEKYPSLCLGNAESKDNLLI